MIGRQPWQLDYKYRSHAALTNTLTNLGASSRLGETKVIENGHLCTVASHHDQPPTVMAQPWAKKSTERAGLVTAWGRGGQKPRPDEPLHHQNSSPQVYLPATITFEAIHNKLGPKQGRISYRGCLGIGKLIMYGVIDPSSHFQGQEQSQNSFM